MGCDQFKRMLRFGKTGESIIANWIKRHGLTVLPIYELEIQSGKGPQLFMPDESLIATDLFVFSTRNSYWIEAKHKTGFTWHRISKRWVTGIDLHHYADYCKIDDWTPWDVWLLFLQAGGITKDCSEPSPPGLFGNTLEFLRKNENHRHENGGKAGMVYWAINNLSKLAEYDGTSITRTIHNPFILPRSQPPQESSRLSGSQPEATLMIPATDAEIKKEYVTRTKRRLENLSKRKRIKEELAELMSLRATWR